MYPLCEPTLTFKAQPRDETDPATTTANVQVELVVARPMMEALPVVPSKERHYTGVRQRRWGKFTAEIRDPAKKGAKVWLGSYATAEEAAMARDRAAFSMFGSKAILNFPLPVNSNEPEPARVPSKRRSPDPTVLTSSDSDINSPKRTKGAANEQVELAVVRPMMEAQTVVPPNERHYAGVRQRRWGKFTAEIRDPAKKGARVWLGSYVTAEEAAMARDRASYSMFGSKAILNFPRTVNLNEPEPARVPSNRRSPDPTVSTSSDSDISSPKRTKGAVNANAPNS